ncbi:MAG TPA: flagellar basal body rod protein FlgB [Porticoccaceae bacterium]|jgi:flagellar basal-body rod protein FlgB|nr:flagellar basal body rod protein FlgB [Porticoccaceae bacterium]
MKLFDSTLGLHGQALSLRSERMEVLSRNIANADTPNFKAQDLDFRSALKGVQQGNEIKTTHAGHVSSFEGASPNLFYTKPLNASSDGNTVEISVEQAKYGRAAAEYQATLRFLEGDISAIRKVLRGD